MSIILSFIPLLLLIAVVVLVVRKIANKAIGVNSSAQPVRLFFQYALTLGLFITFTVGLAGLLGRLLGASQDVVTDQSSLASNLAFVVVGGPLLAWLLLWLKRSIARNPLEAEGFIPTFFATLAAIISLLVFMSSTIAVSYNLIDGASSLGYTSARTIVWGSALIMVLRVSNAVIPKNDFRIQYFVGSLITAIAAIVGLIQVLANLLSAILSQPMFLGAQSPALISSRNNSFDGFATLVVAAALWFYYWIKNANAKTNDKTWLLYVLVAGVGGSLVLALTSLTVTIYQALVWFIGDPASQVISEHFAGIPTSAAIAIVGLLAWWYHKSLLPLNSQRSETQRIYEYVVAAVSLVASTVGIAIITVAIIEAFTISVIVGDDAINTLLGAVTVILVSGPVWVRFWNRIQSFAKSSEQEELTSPIRRIYLFLLFGVGGITAIVSLITVVFQIFNGILSSTFGNTTLNEMRFALGILISTGIVAGYHWEIYRHEKDVEVSFSSSTKSVLLVGPTNPEFVNALKTATGAKITFLQRTDSSDLDWPTDHVIELITQSKDLDLLILLESTGVKVVPVTN
ncbi:MAG: DUF5671 domain-containing protein [Candidatus Nanopelagicales bacterium]|jgi:hypothetical protein|nr:DUF5671 domain-containing protein [Candidatus Nanopelagicales bacterium]MDP4667111.1 DUF5671 domain-containing protein [Candidatus Nanopelagicales bacterium]